MNEVYRILLIEDDERDADLIQKELERLDIEIDLEVISEEQQLRNRLENNPPKLIISDYNLPSFTAMDALKTVREKHLHLPFILVAGKIGEEKAVDAMLKGASDYAMKQNLERLGPAVLREIKNYNEYKEQSSKLEQTRNRYESLVQSVDGIVWEADANTFEFSYVSPQTNELLNYSPEEWLDEPNFWQNHIHPDDRQQAINFCHRKIEERVNHSFEYRMIDANGKIVWLRDYVTVISEDGKPAMLRGFMVDISNEKEVKRQRDKAYQMAGIGDWELDLVHDELFWSDTVKKLHEVDLDYQPDLESAYVFYKEGEHRDNIRTAVENAIETGESFDLELKIITAENNERWVRAVGETEFRDGKGVRIFGSTQDITRRKEVERKLRDVVEHSTNMFYRHDTDHVLSYVSPQSQQFLGCSPEEAKKRWTEFVTDHPINNKGFEITTRAIETGEPQPAFPLQLKRVDGETIWVRVNEAPIVESGETVAIVGSLTDITEQKEYQEQLKQTAERYEYVTKATTDAVWDWNLQNDTVYWGDGIEKLFGFKTEDLAEDSSSWTNHIHPDDKERVQDSIQETIDGDDQYWFEEYRFQKAGGGSAFVEDRGFVIRNDKGEAIRMIGAMRDVTEDKQNEIQNRLQQDVSSYFKKEERFQNVLENVLQHLADFGNFDIAELWLSDYKEEYQKLVATAANGETGEAFFKNSPVKKFAKENGMPGSIWNSKKVEVWNDIHKKESFVRNKAANSAGLTSALGIPLYWNENFMGVLLFGSKNQIENRSNEVDLYKGLQNYLGAEIKRKQQEEEMQLLFESAPDILAIAGPNNQFVKANPAFCELLGYSEEEITSQPIQNFIHPEDLKETNKEYDETITGERQADNFINRWKTKSGDYKWIAWNSSDTYGKDEFVFSYGRDVTEQKKLEQLLRQTNRLARVGSWELDFTGDNEKLYWSEMTREILEVDDDFNPTLQETINFYTPESRERLEESVEKALEEGTSFDHELLVETAKGNELWVRSIGQVEFVDGECVRLYGSYQDIHDRKISELELARRNEFIEAVMDNLSIGIAVNRIDDGEVILMNKKFSEIYGWPQEELTDMQALFQKIFPDEERRQKMIQQITEDIESGDPERMQWNGVCITTKSAEQRIVDCKNIPLYDQNIMVSTAIDKTAEKEAEEEKLQTLERVDDAFFAVDEEWTVTYWNKRAEEVLGMPRENIVDKNLWEVYDDAVDLDFYTQYHKALKEQIAVQFEEYYPTLEKWFEVNAYPSQTGLSVYFRNITERKENEERIRQINERFEKVTEATNDAIWDYDAREDTLFWGKGFEARFGYDLDKTDPTLESLISRIHPEDRDRITQKIKEYMARGTKNDWYEEYRFKKKDGTYAPVMDRAVFIRDENKEVTRVVGAMTDLTRQKKNEEALKKLNKELENRAEELAATNAELEQFAYVASHDLQEPLRMVSSFLKRLEKKYEDQLDDKAQQYIDFAVDGAQRMRSIILDLLNYSRMNQHEFEKESINLNDLLEEIKQLERSAIEESGATIEYEKLPEIKAARTPIRQIFQNLINNAIKYRKPGTDPEITISSNETNEHWQFSVADNGIGIKEEFQDNIFTIFQRLHTQDEYSGTGIGLSVSQKIVEKHGGKVWVESKEGEGSTFYFTLAKE